MKQSALQEEIIDRKQLVKYFSTGAVSRAQLRTGIECEVFAVREEDLKPVPFFGEKGIEAILKRMASNFGWSPVFEGPHVIGLHKGSCSVTLEPGGQIELSCPPDTGIAKCIEEHTEFTRQLREITSPMGIRLMKIAYHPTARLDDVEWVPKSRYREMSKYFREKGGHLAHHMMKLTTSVQTSIDYENEADFSNKIMLASYLTPILQGVYSNSPFKQGRFSGSMDFRGVCWEYTDDDRCGLMYRAFSGNFGFDDYIDFLLDMPMIVRFDREGAVPMKGMPFKEYCKSGPLTMEEWHSHVSFAFPEIRLRRYIELRMCDSVPDSLVPTIPALLKGLFYDSENRKELAEMFKDVSPEEALKAYREAHQKALRAEYSGRPILQLARDIVSLAEQGLTRLGREGAISSPDEAGLLDPLKEQLWEKGMSPAEELVKLWEKNGYKIWSLRDRILL